MIVRINQIDIAAAESAGKWEVAGPRGGIDYAWSPRTFAYQLLVLDHDERSQPLSISLRQKQIRQLIPQVIEALTEPGTRTCIRLDGPIAAGQLLPAFSYLADPATCERFTIAAAQKLDPGTEPVLSSIQMLPTADLLTILCHDAQLGFESGVRLRAFCLPEELVNPLLDTIDADDERWREILPAASFVISTARDFLSAIVCTPIFDAAEIKERIMKKLSAT